MARLPGFNENEVLDKAVDLFWQKGYSDTSAGDLVKCLSLSRSSIYNTFKDKRCLFIKALQRYRNQQSNALLEFLHDREPNAETFQLLLEHVADSSLTAANRGCLMANTASEMGWADKEIQKVVTDNINEVVEALEKHIAKGQQMGALSADQDAKGLAITLFQSITAINVVSKVITDRTFFTRNIETVIQLFKLKSKTKWQKKDKLSGTAKPGKK
jgi:TetR/AcrR family transcriptional regulator, transcriptional repressor for nem operon